MSEDKLSKWLSGNGLLGNRHKNEGDDKVTPKTEKAPQKTEVKEPKPTVRRTTKPAAEKPAGSSHSRGGKKPNHQKNNAFSGNDPFFDRPTHEKRDRFHPTKRLPKGNHEEIRVVPLGGMEQVGENMMFIESKDDIIVIDTGLVFGGQNNRGIDAFLPDIQYLVKNQKKIKAVIYTHGHLDHIGGAPYLLPQLGFPKVYATRLTKDMMLGQCEEFSGVKDKVEKQCAEVTPRSKLKLGQFEVEFFHVNHSIPDGVGIAINTPYGYIVNTSDFKIDHSPADDQPADLARVAQLGHRGVALAMVDSTNAQKPGLAVSESVIKKSLDGIIEKATGRIIIATFSSNIGRVAKLVESAEAHGRTVFLTGRSMEKNIAFARKLNFLKCKDKTLQRMSSKVSQMDPKKVLILSTGSQGEELAALTRMAQGVHRDVTLGAEDTIVFSSSPIPGNEKSVGKILDNLALMGIRPIDNKAMAVHVSGHGNAEELKLMTTLLNSRYFAPIHGEVHMRFAHKDLAVNDLGYKPENCFIMENGKGVVLDSKGARLMTEKERVTTGDKPIQYRRYLSQETVDARKQMNNSGVLVVMLKTEKGKLKSIDYRTPGFLFPDTKDEFFKNLEVQIKAFWDRNYDPARPENAYQKALHEIVMKHVTQVYRPFVDPVVEIVVL